MNSFMRLFGPQSIQVAPKQKLLSAHPTDRLSRWKNWHWVSTIHLGRLKNIQDITEPVCCNSTDMNYILILHECPDMRDIIVHSGQTLHDVYRSQLFRST